MSATVLIVDDDETTRDVLGRLLRLKGFSVKCADGCDAALARLNAGDVSVVLLDVSMPDVDGIETLRRIRHKPETAGVPVVMYTAFDSDDYRRAASELGAADYWVKLRTPVGEMERRLRALAPT